MARRRLTVELDELDYEAVQAAIAHRLNKFSRHPVTGGPGLPDGNSDQWGATIAEICRGWMEMLSVKW